MARNMKYLRALKLYQLAKYKGMNLLGIDLGVDRSSIYLVNVLKHEVSPIECKKPSVKPYVVFDHMVEDIKDVSATLNTVAKENQALRFVIGYPNNLKHAHFPSTALVEQPKFVWTFLELKIARMKFYSYLKLKVA
ncbi:hypothetical protein QYF36_023824 [Acer negundo]|nr:hypothetical protein QYF36_023824 [Acer negundo]